MKIGENTLTANGAKSANQNFSFAGFANFAVLKIRA
jgi:hypothetical protein